MSILEDISPAPWSYDDNREGHEGLVMVFDANGISVVCVGDMEDCDWCEMCNARLMAAAPELYQALDRIVKAIELNYDDMKPGIAGYLKLLIEGGRTIKGARAAIATAEGLEATR